MVQSPGDHNSRGPKKLLQNYTRSLSPGEKLSELEHLRSGGLSLAVAFAFLRALCVRTMVVLVGDSGGTTLRNSIIMQAHHLLWRVVSELLCFRSMPCQGQMDYGNSTPCCRREFALMLCFRLFSFQDQLNNV